MRTAFKRLPFHLGLCRGAFTITTGMTYDMKIYDELFDKYDRTRQEKEDLAVENALLRNSVKTLARDRYASLEKFSLRSCIGES